MLAWHVVLSMSVLAAEMSTFNSYISHTLHDGRMLQANKVSAAQSKTTTEQPGSNSIVASPCFL